MYEEQLSSDHCYQWSVYKEMQEHIYHVCVCVWHPEPLRGYRKKKKGGTLLTQLSSYQILAFDKTVPIFFQLLHAQPATGLVCCIDNPMSYFDGKMLQ